MDERRSCAQGGAGQGERMGWEEGPGHQRRVRGSERECGIQGIKSCKEERGEKTLKQS